MSPTETAEAVRDAARRLSDAMVTRSPCPPVRDLIGADDVAAAYAVQSLLTEARLDAGARIVGRKIGLTSEAVQHQLGVDQPDFGVLFQDMDVTHLDQVPMAALVQPKVEAEIAFVLREDLADGELTVGGVRHAVDYAVAALEIVDSRIAGWDITIADTIADNASSGLFVLGRRRVPLDAFEPVDAVMEMMVDGEVVSRGSGSACLGDPLAALAWLARAASHAGDPLRAGQVILSGALGPLVAVRPAMQVAASISGLGQVSARFSTSESP
jgi:2-keto-4-pentenoate hydratase